MLVWCAVVLALAGGAAHAGSAPVQIAAPVAPHSYPLPPHYRRVKTSAGLVAALARHRAGNVVLADGVYGLSAGQQFVDWNGSRIFAEHVGKATIATALVIGGHGAAHGAVVQGVDFDVPSVAQSFQGAEITVWGRAGRNTRILDARFEGNGVVGIGAQALDPRGFVAQRLVFHNFTDVGLMVSTNHLTRPAHTEVAHIVTDISVDGVSRATPGSSDGTAEAGLWIGQPIADGVHRIKVRNVSISGIETCNNAFDTTFTDLDINMSGPHAIGGVGIYLEHFSRHLTFDNFLITGSKLGFTAEWDNGTPGNAAAHYTTIENGTIDTTGWTLGGPSIGIELDVGTESTTITNVTFKNQSFAAIDTYHTTGTNTFTSNTFSLPPGVPPVSMDHR